jgi:hypothetical protein
MKWLKLIWNFLWKRDLINQTKVDKELINKFAKILDDALDFNLVLKGKLVWFEKYDYWSFTQILNAFIALFSDKMSDNFWTKFELVLNLYVNGKYNEAGLLTSKYLSNILNLNKPNSAEELIIKRQVGLIFELSNKFINKDYVDNKVKKDPV